MKLKKTLSVLNQAYATNYAMTGENLHQEGEYDDLWPEDAIITMLRKYISLDSSYYGYGTDLRTIDGIIITAADPVIDSRECAGMEYIHNDKCGAKVLVFTKVTDPSDVESWMNGDWWGNTGSLGNINGVYGFICAADRCIPTEKTAAIMNSTDPTKSE